MASVVLKSLSILLGIFFVFVGTTKITPQISKELHKDLRKEYVKYAKVFPLTETLDFKVPSKWYRRIIGSLEIIFGLAMAAIPNHKVKNAANVGLLLLMILAAYSHCMVGDPIDRSAPALVFFFMLSGRLVVCTKLTLMVVGMTPEELLAAAMSHINKASSSEPTKRPPHIHTQVSNQPAGNGSERSNQRKRN